MNRGRSPTTPVNSGLRGRSWRPRGHSDRHHSPDSCSGDGMSQTMGRSSQMKPEGNSRYSKRAPGFSYVQKRSLPNGIDDMPELGTLNQKQDPVDPESTPVSVQESDSSSLSKSLGSVAKGKVKNEEFDSAMLNHDLSHKVNISSFIDNVKQPNKCGIQYKPSQENSSEKTVRIVDSVESEQQDIGKIQVEESLDAMPRHDLSHKVNISSTSGKSKLPNTLGNKCGPSQENSEETVSTADSEGAEILAAVKAFDICLAKAETPVMLKPSLLVKNRERRNENRTSIEGQNGRILRSGMVLLKKYLPLSNQIKIVKKCRELGSGSGGFYQPGYRDGARLHLKMMCLGKNWDPETSKYDDSRSIDGAKPPAIPHEFCQLAGEAIKDSHALILGNSTARNVEEILPCMSPTICIVNFYTSTGRLGLHQDRDESQDSLRRRLPVVSFSIGDSAEFLYGDQKDVYNADKIVLESGDVLIFGGESRHIFHGVSAIMTDTAPKALLEETNLRPGRLNLTFRKY